MKKSTITITIAALALAACASPVPVADAPQNDKSTADGAEEEAGISENGEEGGDESIDDETPAIEEEPEVEEAFFTPDDGSWVVTETEVLEDGCSLGDHLDRGEPGSTLELTNEDSPYFQMLFSSGEEPISCEFSDEMDYECDTSSQIDDLPADYGLDALIYADLTTDGFFEDEQAMRMETLVEMVCEGPDCAWITLLLGTEFPCSMVVASDLVVQ